MKTLDTIGLMTIAQSLLVLAHVAIMLPGQTHVSMAADEGAIGSAAGGTVFKMREIAPLIAERSQASYRLDRIDLSAITAPPASRPQKAPEMPPNV